VNSDSTASVVGPVGRPVGLALLLTGMGAVAAVLLFLIDPATAWFLPVCPLHVLTGLHCPGCGATRALHELARGHIGTALRLNALVTLTLPAAAGVWLARRRGWDLVPRLGRPVGLCLLIGVVVVFGIARNIPVYPFALLAP